MVGCDAGDVINLVAFVNESDVEFSNVGGVVITRYGLSNLDISIGA